MKNTQGFLMMVLVVASMGVLSGCATASQDSYTALNDGSGLEKKQPSPTDDMDAIQRTGYYLGWFSLDYLYSWADSSPAYLP